MKFLTCLFLINLSVVCIAIDHDTMVLYPEFAEHLGWCAQEISIRAFIEDDIPGKFAEPFSKMSKQFRGAQAKRVRTADYICLTRILEKWRLRLGLSSISAEKFVNKNIKKEVL